jgi:hypothetical protein
MIHGSWKKQEGKSKIFWNVKKNANTTYQNLGDTAKTLQRRKFIAMSAYIRTETSQINDLMLYLKLLEK